MHSEIIPFDNNHKILPIAEELHSFIKNNGKLDTAYSLLANVCCDDHDGNTLIFYRNPESQYCFYLKTGLVDAYLFFIDNFCSNNIDEEIGFNFLLFAEKLSFVDTDMYKLFNIIKWPSSKKGIEYFNGMKSFSDNLKKRVFDKKISLKEAYLFHATFKNDYDRLLDLFSDDMTYSETNNAIRNLSEYSLKENAGMDELIKLLAGKGKNDFIAAIFNSRFPLYSKYSDKFEKYMGSLKLPKGMKLSADKTFEKEEYSVEFKIKNLTSFKKKIVEINNALDFFMSKDGYEDFLEHDKLFGCNDKK